MYVEQQLNDVDGKTEEFRERSVPVLLCSIQGPHGKPWM
jgi:hypothetical protein